jgi:hypothetical protein
MCRTVISKLADLGTTTRYQEVDSAAGRMERALRVEMIIIQTMKMMRTGHTLNTSLPVYYAGSIFNTATI